MKKILIPTDFTQASLTALNVAAKIARRNRQICLRLAHVYKVPRVPTVTNQDLGYDVRAQRKILNELHKKLQKIAVKGFTKGLKIETQLIPHKEVEDILIHKDNRDVDLIVCGVHGDKDWRQTMKATHTETIIRTADCPVLTVHQNIHKFTRFDNIVFASDFSEESFEAFPAIKKVLNAMGGKLHLVKVITPTNFENTIHVEKQMKEFAKKFYLTDYTKKVFNDQNIELGIHRYAYSVNANLIAMETHGHSGIFHYLKGSILESVANHSDLPVLSMKIKALVTSD